MTSEAADFERQSGLLRFPESAATELFPRALTWLAIVLAYLVANLAPEYLTPYTLQALERLRVDASVEDAATITFHFLVPVKAVLFYLALVVLVAPIARSVIRAKGYWRSIPLRRSLLWAAALYGILCLFAYPDPAVEDPESGLFLMGRFFGDMTLDPFGEEWVGTRARLLKPAIAHLLHLRGHFPYYAFSLFLSFVLIWASLLFLETRSGRIGAMERLRPAGRFAVYLSLFTSCFVLGGFQWPGYVDHVTFLLILLAASIPLTTGERFAFLALAMVNHDASLLAVVPIVLFCFPRSERLRGMVVLGLYFVTILAAHRFSIASFLEYGTHGGDSLTGPVRAFVARHPGRLLAGWFFAFKLLWAVWLYGLWDLHRRGQLRNAVGIACLTLAPLPLTVIAWDTTRLVSYGFLGMLLVVVVVVGRWQELPVAHARVLAVLFAVNILVPSYNFMLLFPWNAIYGLTPGLYRYVHRLIAPLVA
jgi:hypothetical protein